MMVFAGRDVESYINAYKSEKIAWPRACPACGSRLHKHGHYHRKVERSGEPLWVPIQRMYCPKCKRTFSVLPSIFIPRHSMTTHERERIALGAVAGSLGAA